MQSLLIWRSKIQIRYPDVQADSSLRWVQMSEGMFSLVGSFDHAIKKWQSSGIQFHCKQLRNDTVF